MRLIIALLLTLNFCSVNASNIIINDATEPKFTVLLNDWNERKVDISIYTENNELTYRDVIDAATSEHIVYNLKTLESGKYIVVLENDLKKSTEVLSLTTEGLQKISEEIFYKPHIAIKDGRLLINYLAFGQRTKIELVDDNEVLYSESIQGEPSIGRIINVEKLLIGNYTLRIGNNQILEEFQFRM